MLRRLLPLVPLRVFSNLHPTPTPLSVTSPSSDLHFCLTIEHLLRRKQPFSAYSLLLQSHLHSIPLDIQTFGSLAESLISAKADTSYLEVLYCFYRKQFYPSHLMLKCMGHLRKKATDPVRTKVEEDYKYLQVQEQEAEEAQLEDVQMRQQADFSKLEKSNDGPVQKQEQVAASTNISEALKDAQSIVLHDVVFNLDAMRKHTHRNSTNGDWLDVYRQQTLRQRVVQHSQQVEYELDLDRGLSIGRIQINKRKL